jgi:phage terminase large subunit GpA-like protein
MAGANSPAGLASRPIRILLGDEVDRYPVSAGTEGDPVNLARKRTTTFWNRKVLLTSTPTVKGASRIEMEFEESDKRYYFVPCPHCSHYQRLMWTNVQWPKDEPGKAQYCCDNCSALFGDVARVAAVRKGEWRATGPFNGRAGFHINELYSPWSSMVDMVRNFLEAKKSPETLKTFINTSLGETWEDQGETIDNTGLMARREEYAAPVPDGGLILTAGIDVQGDRIEMEVVAWSEEEESWNIDYVALPGDPSQPDVWQLLDDALSRTYTSESGTELHIAASCIDSGGHHTQIVYDYCRQRAAKRVFAVKGVAGPGRPVVQISRRTSGKKTRRVDLYTVGVDDAKGIVYARLRATDPGPGYCHFPVERQEEYFLQLTAEKIVTKYSKGFPRKEWVKSRTRNEALDCRVYSYAALKILNPVWSAIQRRAAKAATKAEPEKVHSVKPTTRKPTRPTRKRGNFVTSW